MFDVASDQSLKYLRSSSSLLLLSTNNCNSSVCSSDDDEEKKAATHHHTQDERRNKFDLNGWERSQGGLHDSDRLLLGEIYGSPDTFSVFEFGLGESTKIAAFIGVPRLSGVDSSPHWVEEARMSAFKYNRTDYQFYFADIGFTKSWGYPVDESLGKITLKYQVGPLWIEKNPFDVYLVDGRYRLACIFASFLHSASTGGDREKVIVCIHDAERYSNAVENVYLEPYRKSRMMICYRRLPNISDETLYSAWLNSKDQAL